MLRPFFICYGFLQISDYKSLLTYSSYPGDDKPTGYYTDRLSKDVPFARNQADEPSRTAISYLKISADSTNTVYFIMFWIYLTVKSNPSGTVHFFQTEDDNGHERHVGISKDFMFEIDGQIVLPVPLNSWFHFTFNSDGEGMIFINGEFIGKKATMSSTNFKSFFVSSNADFQWYIDDIAHGPRTLEEASIKAIYSDKNECATGEHECAGGVEACVNTIGSYYCTTCQSGISDLAMDYTIDKSDTDDSGDKYHWNHADGIEQLKKTAKLSILKLDSHGVGISDSIGSSVFGMAAQAMHVFTFSFLVDEESNDGQEFNVLFKDDTTERYKLTIDKGASAITFTDSVEAVNVKFVLCPEAQPYVFNDGGSCCKNSLEDSSGTPITFSSTACLNTESISCPDTNQCQNNFADTDSGANHVSNYFAITVSSTRVSLFKDGQILASKSFKFIPTRLSKIDFNAVSGSKTRVDSVRLRTCTMNTNQISSEADTEYGNNSPRDVENSLEFVGSDADKASEDTRYIRLDTDADNFDYMVITTEEAIEPADCSLAYYHIFNKKDATDGGFHYTYCGTNNPQRLVLTDNVYVKFYSDSSIAAQADKLKLNVFRGKTKCQTSDCTGPSDNCIELYPGVKCRYCISGGPPLVYYDFQLDEEQVFSGSTVRDKSGNGHHGTFGYVLDAASDTTIVDESNVNGQQILKVKARSPGLRLDLSSFSEETKNQFSLSFFVKLSATGKIGDLVTFYNKDNERVMALMLVASEKVNFWTYKKNDYSAVTTALKTDAWQLCTLSAMKAREDGSWKVIYAVSDQKLEVTIDASDEIVADWTYLTTGRHNDVSDDTYEDLLIDDFKFWDCYWAALIPELRIMYNVLKYDSGKITIDSTKLESPNTLQAIDSTVTLPLLPSGVVYELKKTAGTLHGDCEFTVTDGTTTTTTVLPYESKTGDVKVNYKCAVTSASTDYEITVTQIKNEPKDVECTSEFDHVENWYDFASTTENMAAVLCPPENPSCNPLKSTTNLDLSAHTEGTGNPPNFEFVTSGLPFTSTPTPRLKHSVTIMFWFKKHTDFSRTEETNIVLLKASDGSSVNELVVRLAVDELKLIYTHDTQGVSDLALLTLTAAADGLAVSTYSAYAFTVEAQGQVKAYINGDLKKTAYFNYEEILPSDNLTPSGEIGETVSDNKINFGELRVYSCVLPADIIDTVATRKCLENGPQYLKVLPAVKAIKARSVDATPSTAVTLSGQDNVLTAFKTTGSNLLFLELTQRNIAECGTQTVLYGKAANNDWFNLCDTPLPLDYAASQPATEFRLWFVTSNFEDSLTYRAFQAEEDCPASCTCCTTPKSGTECLDCTLEDLYAKTFIKIHPHKQSQGLATEDTPYGNIGYKVGQVSSFEDSSSKITFIPYESYIYYENVRGVPESGININIALKVNELSTPIMAVYDKNNNLHLTLELRDGYLFVWIKNALGEGPYSFSANGGAQLTTASRGVIGVAITHHQVEFYDIATDFGQTTASDSISPTQFNLINTDWSRVEIGRTPNNPKTLNGEIYSLYITSCISPLIQREPLMLTALDPTVVSVAVTKPYEPDGAMTQQVNVELEKCFTAKVESNPPLRGVNGAQQQLFIEYGSGNLSFADCTEGCLLSSSTSLRYFSKGTDRPRIQFTVDIDECCSGEHSCATNAHCYDVVGGFACRVCHGEGRFGLVASTDFERTNDVVDYRDKHSEEDTIYGGARTNENGVQAGTSFAIVVPELQAPFVTLHFWFQLTEMAVTTLIQTTGDFTIVIAVIADNTDYKITFNVAGTTYSYQDVLIVADTLYEVAMMITPAQTQVYLNGMLVHTFPQPTTSPVALGDLQYTDINFKGFIQDLEIWNCEKEEYKSKTEMLHSKMTTAEGVIKADKGKSSNHEHVYSIKPTGVTDLDGITYKLTKNNLDCSYTDVLVLEKVTSDSDAENKEWKSYCDPTANIFGYTKESAFFVKYVNYKFLGSVPDFYFHYIADSNECADSATNCAATKTCSNTLSSFLCVDCSLLINEADESRFNAEHTLMFDFETVNDRIVSNAYAGGASGMLHYSSDVAGSFANHYLDATSAYKGKLTVDGQTLNRIPSTKFTIAMFVNLQESVAGVRPLFYSYSENGLPNIVFELHNGKPYIELRASDNNYLMTTFTTQDDKVVATGDWTFVGAVFNGETIELYVGKQKDTSSALAYKQPISQDWSGGVKIGHRDESTFLNGKLDDFRLIGCSLTQTDIIYLVNTFTPDCTLQISANDIIVADAGTSHCAVQIPTPSPATYYLLTSERTCTDDRIKIKLADGTVIDMCDEANRPLKISGEFSAFYTAPILSGQRGILSYTMETDYCSPLASTVHNCGDGSNCFNGENKFICMECLEEFGEQLRLYYDFDDNGKILNKAPATKSDNSLDINTATLAVDNGVLNNGLMQQTTTNLQFATGLDARFMIISFWVTPDVDVNTKQMLFEVAGEIEISITGLEIEASVNVDGENYLMSVSGVADDKPSYVQLSFNDKNLVFKATNSATQFEDSTTFTGAERFDWTTSKEVKIGNDQVPIDEFRIYACASLKESIRNRKYVFKDLVDESDIVTAPSVGITEDSYEGRWYITKPAADKVIFVDFLSLPKDGAVKYRDETTAALNDGRDLWVTVDELHLVAFTESAVIAYYLPTSPHTEINGLVFEYYIDDNQCAGSDHGCGTTEKCVNVPGGHYCKECSPDDSLILHFDFEAESISENKITDRSANDNHGVIVNSIKTTATQTPIGAYATFAVPQGIIVHNMRPVPKHTFTLVTWVRISAVTGHRPLFNAYDTSGALVFSIDLIKGVLTFTLPGAQAITADSPVVANKMTHIAVTISRESIDFYVNGVKSGGAQDINAQWSDNWELVEVGKKENRQLESLRGDLDQLRVYDCYLSAEQITELYEEFDPDTYYCSYNGDKTLAGDSFTSPSSADLTGFTKINCKYTVTLDAQYVLYFTVTGADSGLLQITEVSGEGDTLTAEFLQTSITNAVFSLQWTKELNECYGSTVCVNNECVNRIGESAPMCRNCNNYDESRLKIYYKFDYKVNNEIRNRADILGTLTGASVATSNTQIGSATEAFEGHYLDAPVEFTSVPTSYRPTAAFTIFARVITSTISVSESVIYESTFSDQFVRLSIADTNVKFEVKHLGQTGSTIAINAVSMDKWITVLATFEPDGTMKVKTWKEGSDPVSSTAATDLDNRDFPVNVWANMNLASASLKLDEFMLFDCALGADMQAQLLGRNHVSTDLTKMSGKISIPQSADKRSFDHTWTIKRPLGTHMTVSLDIQNFNVDCSNGYLEIKTSAEGVFKRYCGTAVNDVFRLIDDDVVVRYVGYNMDNSVDMFNIYYTKEVNECLDGTNDCEADSCINTFGSYHCRQCKNGEDDAILFLNFEKINGIEISDANDKNVVAVSSAHDVLIDKTQSTCKNYLMLPTGRSIRVMADKLRYIPSRAFTIEMRVNLQDLSGCRPLFTVNHKDKRHIIQLDVENGDLRFALMTSDGQEISFATSTQPITVAMWHRVSVIYDGAAVKMHVDGTEVATHPFTGQVNQHWSSLDVGVKDSAPSLSLNGLVDEVKLYGCYVSSFGHHSCSMATYYCDDTFNESPWKFPTSGQLTGYDAVDCSLTIPPGSHLYLLSVDGERIVCSNVERFTYSINGGEDIDYCANGHQWPEDFLVEKFNLHYKANSVTDTLRLIVKKSCGENEHYYPEEDLCNCKNGYIKNSKERCQDLNECRQSLCQANTVCVNEQGSFSCHCLPGFTPKDEFSCKAKDPCLKTPCRLNERCIWTNTDTTDFECVCPSEGFQLVDGKCMETTCAGVTCEANAYCINGACQCSLGYQEDSSSKCRDRDECKDAAACGENEVCHNTKGSFTCTCKKGFAYNEIEGKCLDLNECLVAWNCPANSVCTNKPGGFECQCKPGYSHIDEKCFQLRPCGQNTCSEHAHCDELSGTCNCKAGFYGNGQTCSDVNECDDSSPCNHDNEKCENNDGSFQCICKGGHYRRGALCVKREETGAEEENNVNEDEKDDGYYLAPNGNRYKDYFIPMSWMDAADQCTKDGARISLVEGFHRNEQWLGGRRSADESMWKMSDGSNVPFFRWAEGYPKMDVQFESCLYSTQSGWTDVDCPLTAAFVCEIAPLKQNVDVCNDPCGENGVRNEVESGITNEVPCNRFPCYQSKQVKKTTLCIQLPSPYEADFENQILKKIGWNEDNIMHALKFSKKWHTLLYFDASWNDESCFAMEDLREQYDNELANLHATLEHLSSMTTYLRAMYDCNSNPHIRHQLIQLYEMIVTNKWRTEKQVVNDDITQRFHFVAQICAGSGWLSLSKIITSVV